LFQKLFHTPSVSGQEYDPKTWVKKLGLPPPEDLGGLDLRIKSVFLLPFSVMHPKFMIIDRKTVVLPSCNISWEEWFEGAMVLSGDIVDKFLEFYCKFWERRDELRSLDSSPSDAYLKALLSSGRNRIPGLGDTTDYGKGHVTSKCLSDFDVVAKDVPTIFLPSPHRRNPHFQPFASMDKMRVPPTPLNSFFLLLLEKAERSIRIQTPNLTSPPVLSALLKALTRGVDVRILTSARLMILEQLVTAGTTTSFCVKRLIRRYKKLIKASSKGSSHASDEEAAIPQPRHGRLQISYFAPVGGLKRKGQEDGEPQQSHLKMLIVDDEALVLGSGNLDRASWFTSQELGVAFFDRSVVDVVQRTVDTGMQGREKVVYDSSA
jgi:phosphatidylserine/phosphatidylglycerophosphate/cardiolipin synthase-like enzyme